MANKINIKETVEKVKDTVVEVGKKTEETVKNKYKDISGEVVKAIDYNGDGKLGLEDLIILALKNDNVRVDRAAFLKKALMKCCDEETIQKAIDTTPAKAHVKKEYIDNVAKECINKQTFTTTLASVGLGYVPGGLAVDVASTVADVGQYYVSLLIAMQKLMYLYGFPQLDIEDGKDVVDDGTMNMIIICLGAMFGVNEACKALGNVAEHLAAGVQKQMMKAALTKGVVWKITKKILIQFDVKLTKDLASKAIANSIKVLGGALIGGITFVSFQSCGKRFMDTIENTMLSNPEKYDISNIIDVDVKATVEKISEEIAEGIDITLPENEKQ